MTQGLSHSAPPADASISHVTTPWISPDSGFVAQFPVSINERRDRIAAIASRMGNFEWFFPQWIIIKDARTDRLVSTIDLVPPDLAFRLLVHCDYTPSTCRHLDEVNQRVDAANTELAKDQWRPFPCFRGMMQPERKEPGCERFFEAEVNFDKTARLRVSHKGRVVLNELKPTWPYRDRSSSCNAAAETDTQSDAFDPETGILVVGLQFWATFEGCSEPLWNFHPVRLPALRGRPALGLDGGAP